MHTLLELISKIFTLRTCKYDLSKENIRKGKFKVCLEYHIGNCKGPCEGLQEEQEYDQAIQQIKKILKGDITLVIRQLKNQMHLHAERLEFEQAHIYKEKVESLEKYQSRSTVVSPHIKNADVISYQQDNKVFYVNYLRIIDGAIVQSHTMEFKKKLEETPQELLPLAIMEYRQRFHSDATEIILPLSIDISIPGVKLSVPKIGEKKSLLDLSMRNLSYYRKEREKQKDLLDPGRNRRRIMETMQKDLRLKEQPTHIECFDNSNIQGGHAVAAMVVFKEGKPDKKAYRHYNIKNVTGADDYKTMEEVIFRRYKRLLAENKPRPQLIIIDGGKGQLNAAMKSLEKLELHKQIAVIGIAKRLEEIYFPGDPVPIYLDKRSETLKIIQQARDEAHRFGITHYRKKHQKTMRESQLLQIQGIGKKTAGKLLNEFGSVSQLKKAEPQQIETLVGKQKAKILHDYLRNHKTL
ncbi:MAG: excinuclease ABC subunit UvrC [Bacteroidales bacterium]